MRITHYGRVYRVGTEADLILLCCFLLAVDRLAA